MPDPTDFSFTVDDKTYELMKKFFETYEDMGNGRGTISKGTVTEGMNSTDCFQIKFMQHQSDSFFSNKPMNKVYIRKMNCQ